MEFAVADLKGEGSAEIITLVDGSESQMLVLAHDGYGGARQHRVPVSGRGLRCSVGGFDNDQGIGVAVLSWTPQALNILRNIGDSLGIQTAGLTGQGETNRFTITNRGRTPGREDFKLFVNGPCAGLPNSGPPANLGLCVSSPLSMPCLASQLSMPPGAEAFHLTATGSTPSFGPVAMPALYLASVNAVCFELIGGIISEVSLVDRCVIP